MHKTVLIILAAVVALIVIVVLTGMRYLRADDDDEFDDDMTADRGQSRGRVEHPAREHWRTRHHDDDRSGDRGRQRARADRVSASRTSGKDRSDRDRPDREALAGAGAGRRGSTRDETAGAGRGATARGDLGRPTEGRDGAGRDVDRSRTSRDGYGRDSAGRDSASRDGLSREGGPRSADRRGPGRDSTVRDLPGRDTGSRRGGERGWDDAGRDDRRNSGPHRRPPASRDFDVRDSAEDLISASAAGGRGPAGRDGPRTDDFEDRAIGTSTRDYPRGQDGGRSTGSRDDRTRDDRGRDDRERRGNSGQNARPDSRRTAGSPTARRDDSLPDVKPRPAKTTPSKSKRDGDGDWPSTEWDELSDVDYWAELASDKPLPTTAPSPTPASRSDRDRADARSEPDSGPIPVRAERRDSPDRSPDRRNRDARDARDRDTTERHSTERRDQPLLPAARASRQTVDAAFAPPVVGDLGDPAFSARTESYGSTELRRAIASGRTSTSGQHRMPQPADDDPLTSPSFPRINADDSRSYRQSGGRGQGEGQPQTRPHPTYPAAPTHPPVGPLDSQPGLSRTGGGYSQPATTGMEYAAAPLADPYLQPSSASADSHQALPAISSYSTPAPALPAPALPAANYLPSAGNGYSADSATNAYSTPMSTSSYSASPGSYPPADPPSYQAPLTSPSPAAYLGDHGNGYPASTPVTSGYSQPPAPSYPAVPPEQPGYSGYSGAGQVPAAQPQSTGFSYSQSADPGFASQLPTGQPTGSYLGYQTPPPTSQAGVYQMPQAGMLPPQTVQPGYPTAPYNAAPYEPSAYPTASYEAEGGYPADPYAVDPYGYPGYGAARLSDQRWRGQPLSDQRWEERSRQEQSWDDRPGPARYEYPQYWEDDDR